MYVVYSQPNVPLACAELKHNELKRDDKKLVLSRVIPLPN